MANRSGNPNRAPCSRSTRTPKAWKVDTVRPRHRWRPKKKLFFSGSPARRVMRSRISAAALFVNVTARMARAGTPWSSRWTTRWAMTRVLPEPAPARTSTGPSVWSTAARCWGFSRERSSITRRRIRRRCSFHRADRAPCSLLAVPLLAERFQALLDARLLAGVARLVEAAPLQLVGEVLLGDVVPLEVVRVAVAARVPHRLHQRRGRVSQLERDRQRPPLQHGGTGFGVRRDHGVALGAGGEEGRGLRHGQRAFGK